MNKIFLGITLVIALIAGALVLKAMQESSARVLMPSALLTAEHAAGIARVRVAGRVAALPIEYRAEPPIELRFQVHDPGGDSAKLVSVVYHGLRPDMFAAGRDVIIDGEFTNGTLQASKLLTQCPSKYEPPKPGAPKAE